MLIQRREMCPTIPSCMIFRVFIKKSLYQQIICENIDVANRRKKFEVSFFPFYLKSERRKPYVSPSNYKNENSD
jgi:hypothetical protein